MGYLLDLRKVVGKRPIVTAGSSVIILNDKDQILMIHRSDNSLWGLPAGSTEIKESPADTAIREVFEETGITLDPNRLNLLQVFGGKDFFYTYPNGDQCSNVVTSYYTQVKGGDLLKISAETDDIRWFESSSLPVNIATHEKIILNYFYNYKNWKLKL